MIQAALIGFGWWGQNIARAVHGKSDRLRFKVAVTKTPEVTQSLATSMGLPQVSEFEQVLADPEIQAVVLATPHSWRSPMTMPSGPSMPAARAACHWGWVRTNAFGPAWSSCAKWWPVGYWAKSCTWKATTATSIQASFSPIGDLHPANHQRVA